MKPAIVTIGFNRPDSLSRLLRYLSAANYDAADIPLVISVDYSDTPEGKRTREVAEQFEWKHGDVRLMIRDHNMGLRDHVLSCGDLTNEYGSIIMLEDDLTVGPEFYRYSTAALKFTDDNGQIGGVSLYDHRTNFVCRLPFTPAYDGFDNYYLQIASSWGQAWTEKQWNSFRKWYDDRQSTASKSVPDTAPIPRSVANWPQSSWLKYFIWYLVETNRWFLYPRHSHSTNHSDSGTHVSSSTPVWQVPLAMSCQDFRFSELENAIAVYDSFFEILPEKLKQFSPSLKDYDFDVDLYGSKQASLLNRPYVLTSRKPKGQSELQFDLARKPMTSNFVECCSDADSSGFHLVKPDQLTGESGLSLKLRRNVEYFFGLLPFGTIIKNSLRYYLQKKK